jgi:acyl-CoA:6-aminopenicillanic acid acyl transferase
MPMRRAVAVIAACGLAVAVAAFARGAGGALEFREEVAAGGPSDFTTVRHLVLRGSNFEIGKKLAEIARSRHDTKLSPADPLVGPLRVAFFRDRWPAHFERMRGAAAAFDATVDGPLDAGGLAFDLGGEPGCSVVFYPPASTESGHAILSRNYDFSTATYSELLGRKPAPGEKAMDADTYVIETTPDRGYPSLYLCAYDLLGGCIDGMNSKGLTVALLADDESAAKGRVEPNRGAAVGLDEIEIGRFLLDTCATVDEAKAALLSTKQYYAFTLCHYLIGDRSGRSFVWEHSPSFNVEHVVDGVGKPQIVTNHPLHRYHSSAELPHEDAHPESSYTRYRALEAKIAAASGKLSLDAIKSANACVSAAGLPGPGGKPGRTLWHALYDATDGSLAVDFYLGESPSGGAPRRSGYLAFRLGDPSR